MAAPRPIFLGESGGTVLVLPRWVWDGQALRSQAGVVLEVGRWSRVGPADELRSGFAGETMTLPQALVTPGLVNWHVHLELSAVGPLSWGRSRPGSFVDWLGEVMAAGPRGGEDAAEAALAGLEACRQFGVAQVHDITRHPRHVRRALLGHATGVHSYGEVTGLARRRARATPMLEAACDVAGLEHANLSFGISPHAPYSTELGVYAACQRACRTRRWALTTHLAETPDERRFVEQHTGPFRTLWDRLGDWSDDVPRSTLGDIAAACGPRPIIAHGNDLRPDELARLAGQQATIVHCPRTHAYFGRPTVDLAAWHAAGLRIRIGTDSLASCPDLNVLEDLRLIARQHPKLPAADIWQMATEDPGRGAAALAWDLPADETDPLDRLLGRQNSPADAADDSRM